MKLKSSLRYLDCNAPGFVQGYTSPAFGSNAGVIIARGYPHYIKSAQFFTAMGIRPISLTEQEAKSFIIQHSRGLSTNVVLETQIAPPQPPAAPPVVIPTRNMTVTFINRGAYVAKYTVEYNLLGRQKLFNTPSIAAGNRFTIEIPGNVQTIATKGVFYNGVSDQTHSIFNKSGTPNTHNDVCISTYGTIFKASYDSSCN